VGLPVADASGGHQPGPGCLSVFRIADDGTLSFLRKYDVDVGTQQLFWTGMVGYPAQREG
jgi:hypothetical protein